MLWENESYFIPKPVNKNEIFELIFPLCLEIKAFNF